MVAIKILLVLVAAACIEAKVYSKCGLAQELRNTYRLPAGDISKWVCIARYESSYNTRAVNAQSGDYGIFQISHYWWCGPGKSCGKPCSAYMDDNIADDVACALKIKAAQGFSAWVAYNNHCTGDTSEFTRGCF